MPAFGDPTLLISTLLMAYLIHDFMTQNIMKNPNKQDYRLIIGVTFLFGTLIYTFITLGSFGILSINQPSSTVIPLRPSLRLSKTISKWEVFK